MSEEKQFDITDEPLNDNGYQQEQPVSKTEPVQKKETLSSLTTEEIEDTNSITVEISNPIPIIVLFGAKRSGKTMTLIRLSRYLKDEGYTVEPVRDFRPANSGAYKKLCDEFENNIYQDVAADSTDNLSFMLVKVSKNGKDICQILEAPGEHYFDADNELPFPTYIHTIINNSLPKTWVVFVEKNWENGQVRGRYSNKVASMFNLMSSKDKVILLCHKADKHLAYFNRNQPRTDLFSKDIKNQYPAIFGRAGGQGFFSSLSNTFTQSYEFVVFSAGTFTTREGGGQTYIASNEVYPKRLWEKILKTVKGSWF